MYILTTISKRVSGLYDVSNVLGKLLLTELIDQEARNEITPETTTRRASSTRPLKTGLGFRVSEFGDFEIFFEASVALITWE
jgi:hypothetical protein